MGPLATATKPAPKQPIDTGPRYRTYEIMDWDERAQKKEASQIQTILKGGTVPQQERQRFEDYYKKWALSRWTAPDRFPNLAACRKDLQRDFWYSSRNENGTSPAHQQLTALALDFFSNMAKDANVHPASRCAATVALGDLNEQESVRAMEYPRPVPAAFPTLMGLVTDANQPDIVKLAALIGIRRHVTIRVAQGAADANVPDAQVLGAMLAMVQAEPSPQRSAEGHYWMQALAIDVLGALRQVGDENAAANALAGIVAEQGGPLLRRRPAARALGNLDYPADHGLDPSELATGLGQLAVDACTAELAQIEKEIEQEQRGTRRGMRPGMGYPGMMYPGSGDYERAYEAHEEMERSSYEEMYEEGYGPGMMPGMAGRRQAKDEEEKGKETLNNRRRLAASLDAVLHGLTGQSLRERGNEAPKGVAGLATAAPHDAFVKSVRERVDALMDVCGTKDFEDKEAFRTKLEEELALLKEVLNPTPATAATTSPPAGS